MTRNITIHSGQVFPEEQILEQVRKIFLWPSFSVSDILRRFLTYIVSESIAGRSNTIKEYTIAVHVLNKPIHFKPQLDAIVRIHAGRLRRALEEYYQTSGNSDKIEITIPKGGYVPEFSAGHSVAVTRESELPGKISDTALSSGIRIAVMPFDTLETDLTRLSFSNSLGEQLSAELGKFAGFSVISYYILKQLGSSHPEIENLASHFDVRFVLTGNVVFAKSKLRVTVQLTDTESGVQVWTELYHFSFSSANYFHLTDKIVAGVIARIGDFNGIIVQQEARLSSGTLSKYYHFYAGFNVSAFKTAYEAMKEAVNSHSPNELEWAFYGELSMVAFLFNQKTSENPLTEGLHAARMSLKLNPQSQQGFITLGMANIFLHNKDAGMDALEHALKLNPHASGSLGIIGCLMIGLGEYARGRSLIEKSIDSGSFYPQFFKLFLSLYYFKRKDYLRACEESENMVMPDMILNAILRMAILSRLGRKQELDELRGSLRKFTLAETWISREYIRRFLFDDELVAELDKSFKMGRFSRLTVA